jgi:hypothetical protein
MANADQTSKKKQALLLVLEVHANSNPLAEFAEIADDDDPQNYKYWTLRWQRDISFRV